MRLCLFEDRRVTGLAPFAVARPVFDLLGGLGSLRQSTVRHFQPDSLGFLVRKALVESLRTSEPHAPVNDPRWLRSGPTWMVNARWIPGRRPARPLARSPFLALCDGEIAYALLSSEQLTGVTPASLDDCFDDWRELLPIFEVDGRVVGSAADLLPESAERITAEFPSGAEGCTNLPAGVALIGSAQQLHLDPSATVEPMVLLDTTRGPIVIAAQAHVRAFTRIEGPCAIGAGSIISSGSLSGAAIGPQCRIAGTLNDVVVGAHSEIAPGCVLRGAYLGEGVQAGPNAVCDWGGTGEILIGDFARLAAGVLLERGTTIGAFARIAATGWPAPHGVPAFGIVSRDGVDPNERANKHLHDVVADMETQGRRFHRGELELYRELAGGGTDLGHRTLPLPFRRAG